VSSAWTASNGVPLTLTGSDLCVYTLAATGLIIDCCARGLRQIGTDQPVGSCLIGLDCIRIFGNVCGSLSSDVGPADTLGSRLSAGQGICLRPDETRARNQMRIRTCVLALAVTAAGSLSAGSPARANTPTTPGTDVTLVASGPDATGFDEGQFKAHRTATAPTATEAKLSAQLEVMLGVNERVQRVGTALVVSSNLKAEMEAWGQAIKQNGGCSWIQTVSPATVGCHSSLDYKNEVGAGWSEISFGGFYPADTHVGTLVKAWMESPHHRAAVLSKSAVIGAVVVCTTVNGVASMTALVGFGQSSILPSVNGTVGVDPLPGTSLTKPTDGDSCGGTSAPVVPTTAPSTNAFASLPAPVRTADTRSGGPVTELTVNVGTFGVPSTATGVALNVTATAPSGGGFVSVYSCDAGWSGASSLNFTVGETVANFAPSALGASRTVCLRSSVSTHLIVDVIGYWTSKSAFRNAAGRRGDSRSSGVLSAGSVFRVDGFDPTLAHIVNVTGVSERGSLGFLAVYDCAAGSSGTSALNFAPGEARAASFPVLTPSGSLCVLTSGGGDVIVDEVATFASSEYHAATGRLFDSRNTGGAARSFEVPTGSNGPVAITVTAVASTAAGFATVWPCAQAMPTASTLNHPGGVSAVANTTIVTGGRACVYLSSAAQVIVDRLGSL
jgi:hypothetical protein